METKIKIKKNQDWIELRLDDNNGIYYNSVINRIGKIATREIGHSNTFSVPYISQNIDALDLSTFNPKNLAVALNKKYEAKYFVEGKVLKEGFLVINNITDGKINLNMIDGSLSLVEKWGSMTYAELLNSNNPNIPEDYQAVINQMRSYVMSKTSVLTPLPDVGTRGYKLALFPNNLNTMGDKFQQSENDIRLNNSFNPYQSRPIFSTMSFLDIIIETFDYTPLYDDSVDWDEIAHDYIVSDNLNKNLRDEGLSKRTSSNILSEDKYGCYWTDNGLEEPQSSDSYVVFVTSEEEGFSLRPKDIPNWTDPPTFFGWGSADYVNRYCVFVPLVSESNAGQIRYLAQLSDGGDSDSYDDKIYSVWKNAGGGAVLFKTITPSNNSSSGVNIDITFDKSEFDTPPSGAGDFIGVIFQRHTENDPEHCGLTLSNLQVVETYVESGIVTFDKYNQYYQTNVDLTFASPRKSIKKILTGILQKNGILMSINHIDKTVLLFSYGKYEKRRDAGEYEDWSQYFLKEDAIDRNTDFGNEYGKTNLISLSDPFPGNIAKIYLTNQGEKSKYKDSAENKASTFKDVTGVLGIENTSVPYFEYTNPGFGLVYSNRVLNDLTQVRADETSQGTITDLPAVSNVNYFYPPNGVREWYKLVDEAIRANPKFILPVHVAKYFDISKPVYIDALGGFYIVEEIKEYSNSEKPVTIKLIKLIDTFGNVYGGDFYEPDFNNDFFY